MATTKITLSLPTTLVERLKALVPPRQRSAFVAEALQERLEEEETLAVLEETAGILSAEDYPYWDTDEDIDRWLREFRSSWTIPDFSED
ncbi:MAG: CopG family transcriptional regulator [Anaerolineae bacterium]